MVGLDWFPVAEGNLLSFFSRQSSSSSFSLFLSSAHTPLLASLLAVLHTIQNIEHLEIGEALELFVLRSLFCFAFPRRVSLVRADLLPFLPFVRRAYEYNPPPSWTRIDLPKLHTLAISGDGMSTWFVSFPRCAPSPSPKLIPFPFPPRSQQTLRGNVSPFPPSHHSLVRSLSGSYLDARPARSEPWVQARGAESVESVGEGSDRGGSVQCAD